MENTWTTPVKIALLLSFLAVLGTFGSAWIEWRQLDIMRHPAVVQDQHYPPPLNPTVAGLAVSTVAVLLSLAP